MAKCFLPCRDYPQNFKQHWTWWGMITWVISFFLAVYYPIFSILKSIFYLWIAVKSFDSMGLHTIPNPEPFPIKTHIQRKYQNRSNVQGAWSRTSPANQGTLTELVCKVPSSHLGTLSQEQAIGGWERSMVQGVIHSSNFNLYTLLQKIFLIHPHALTKCPSYDRE